ncbi:ATP-dependent RNA helicase DDX3X [Nematocida ausubeli]|nr:ATP-dependent RNA helicase DDX3X [Nematocida ausubeli]
MTETNNYVPPSMNRQKENFLESEENGVRTKTKDKVTPMSSFKGQLIASKILENMKDNKITTPTLVQRYVMPLALHARDLLISAPTGMGKTISFLVPTLNFLYSTAGSFAKKNKSFSGERRFQRVKKPTLALILVPTRELAIQIYNDSAALIEGLPITCGCVYGGVPKKEQIPSIINGVDLLIGTPGRIQDYLNYPGDLLNLSNIQVLIFDEADRMLDMGFEKQIRGILARLDRNQKRQTMMFSATFPPVVRKLAQEFFQQAPEEVHIGNGPIENIMQEIIQIEGHSKKHTERNERLMKILLEYGYTPSAAVEQKAFFAPRSPAALMQWGNKTKEPVKKKEKEKEASTPKIVIFVEKKEDCTTLSDYLHSRGILCTTLHGDKKQAEREFALSDFKDAMPILIATSVAARGLDVPGIVLVVNYMMPADVKEYIHRIGRTGRAGKTGRSITFFTWDDQPQAASLIEILQKANQEVPKFLQDMAHAKSSKGGRGGKSFSGGNFTKKKDDSGQHFTETQEIKRKEAPVLSEKIEIQKNLSWD